MVSHICLFSPSCGEDSQFDEHTFQMRWNHQLERFLGKWSMFFKIDVAWTWRWAKFWAIDGRFCTTWHSMPRKESWTKIIGWSVRWSKLPTDLARTAFKVAWLDIPYPLKATCRYFHDGRMGLKIPKKLQGTCTSYTRIIFRSSRFDHTPALTKLRLCFRFIICLWIHPGYFPP